MWEAMVYSRRPNRVETSGFAVVEGTRSHVIPQQVIERTGRGRNGFEFKRIHVDRQTTTMLHSHVDTARPIVVSVFATSIIFDAAVLPRRRQNRIGTDRTLDPCRIQVVIPQTGTIVLWGHAATIAKFEMHDHAEACIYAANCQ